MKKWEHTLSAVGHFVPYFPRSSLIRKSEREWSSINHRTDKSFFQRTVSTRGQDEASSFLYPNSVGNMTFFPSWNCTACSEIAPAFQHEINPKLIGLSFFDQNGYETRSHQKALSTKFWTYSAKNYLDLRDKALITHIFCTNQTRHYLNIPGTIHGSAPRTLWGSNNLFNSRKNKLFSKFKLQFVINSDLWQRFLILRICGVALIK